MEAKNISIAKDFSEFPGGRFIKQGSTSGEAFRERILKPSLEKYGKVFVNIDGVEGYGSSFLEEAFGGIVRKKYMSLDELKAKLEIVSEDEAYHHYVPVIWGYINRAKPEQ